MLELYESTRKAADTHKSAGEEARKLVPEDVKVVLAGAHKLSRNKKGVVSITRIAS